MPPFLLNHMPHLALAPDVHLAVVDGDLVFLDAAADQYLCVARRRSDPVLAALAGHVDIHDPEQVIAALLDARLLIEARHPANWSGAPACTARDDLGRDLQSRPGAGDIALLLLAALRMTLKLRTGTPSRWFAKRLARRRPAAVRHGETVRDCARRAERLRPLIPRSGRCLVRSLLMLEYLLLRGVEADWVFGVRTHPFEAHCWVEYDGTVLTDSLEHVRWFTPILLV